MRTAARSRFVEVAFNGIVRSISAGSAALARRARARPLQVKTIAGDHKPRDVAHDTT
jgi:hypothetical protein